MTLMPPRKISISEHYTPKFYRVESGFRRNEIRYGVYLYNYLILYVNFRSNKNCSGDNQSPTASNIWAMFA